MGLILLLYILCGPWARADDLERIFLREMTHARSPAALEQARADYTELKIARSACHLQLATHSVPAACYEQAHLEARFGHAPVPARMAKLDRLCARASEAHVYAGDLGQVSSACAASVRLSRQIQAYRREDAVDWPTD